MIEYTQQNGTRFDSGGEKLKKPQDVEIFYKIG